MSDIVRPARPRQASPLRATCPEDAERVLLTTRRVEGETRNPLAILDLAPYIRRYSGRHVESYYWEDLPDRSYDAVGLSILQHTASDDPIDDLLFLKQKYAGARIVVGGKWVDTLTEDECQAIRNHGIDVCHGQGESYFVPDRPIVDFDRYPGWDLRDLQTFMGWDPEIQKLFYRARPEVMSTRGCPFNCHFCHNTERKVKFFSSARTVDNIELLLGQGCPEIWFQDDIFTLRPSYYQPCKGTTGYEQAMARNPEFGVARNEDITYVDPNLTRELMQEYRGRMMARPKGVTNPEWRTAAGPSVETLGV